MADDSEIDRVLAQYGSAGQGLNTLAASVPEAGPETLQSRLRQAHEWLTRNVLERAQYAGLYPARVAQRMYPDWPVPAHEQPSRVGLRRRMGEGDKYGGPLPIAEIDAMGTYTPSGRESSNVEDRRPKSPWEYADGGEVDGVLAQYLTPEMALFILQALHHRDGVSTPQSQRSLGRLHTLGQHRRNP
jgi:hypothetical protein